MFDVGQEDSKIGVSRRPMALKGISVMNPTVSIVFTHLLVIVSVVAFGTVASIKANFDKIAQSATKYASIQRTGNMVGAISDTPTNGTAGNIESVNDAIMFLLCSGGGLIGAYCGVASGLIPIDRHDPAKRSGKIAQALSLAVCTSMLGAPVTVHYCFHNCHWSLMLLIGGGFASGSVLIWATYQAILNRFVTKAQQDGIAGVISEATGVTKK